VLALRAASLRAAVKAADFERTKGKYTGLRLKLLRELEQATEGTAVGA
jgi:hypothetical protein